ncbi:glycosyltransferase family 2 protein [Stenotrophomonas rhizophila]|jgi:glycosyltransferase involved in cell wall biosynthesis|uniref:glycosyltransferase family 2 protein n=1 Tax=Stenotrophomonas TaxID=40323 RepID=UPI0013178F02|nr:glycosyltransferase family 2 protein [Stenotrophomonas sp. 364]QHB73241.1 glycosyltransferase [Stenotrophomonas sp. 364]
MSDTLRAGPPAAPFAPLVVIPVYDHEHAIGAVVRGVLASGLPCLLVDDGSHPACAQALDALAAGYPAQVTVLRLPANQGKGGAMLAGFAEAARRGHSHVLQIDADGQHDPTDIPRFVALSRQHPDAVICGIPAYDDSVPKARLYGRYATHIWVWINTLSLQIRDSMCGFRLYPLAPVTALVGQETIGRRMDFDSEILVRLFWRDVPVISLSTRVTYPSDGVSHFDVWRDNVRISRMHTRLFFGMLWRAPRLLWRRITGAPRAGAPRA